MGHMVQNQTLIAFQFEITKEIQVFIIHQFVISCIYVDTFRTRLVHCNDYYMKRRISIARNTLSWNVISITIHYFSDYLGIKS